MAYTLSVSPDDYIECVGFTMYAYLADKIAKRDLMKGSERSFGEFLEHFIRGKIAESAFKKYVMKTLRIDSLIDVDLPFFIEGMYLPDILALKTDSGWDSARFWIEVKAVTGKQRWMLLPTTSVKGGKRKQPRPYCAYISCRVDLPQDHVARLMKYAPKIAERMGPEWREMLADIEGISVAVLGYALYQDISNILSSDAESSKVLDEVFGPGNWRYLRQRTSFKDPSTGKKYGNFGRDNCVIRLTKLRQDWTRFARLLKRNKPLAPENHRGLGRFEYQMEKAFGLLAENGFRSWFERGLNGGTISLEKWI